MIRIAGYFVYFQAHMVFAAQSHRHSDLPNSSSYKF